MKYLVLILILLVFPAQAQQLSAYDTMAKHILDNRVDKSWTPYLVGASNVAKRFPIINGLPVTEDVKLEPGLLEIRTKEAIRGADGVVHTEAGGLTAKILIQ